MFGGAARAARRIHQSLINAKMDSRMLVSLKQSFDNNIDEYHIWNKHRKLKFLSKLLKLQASTNPTHHSCNLFSSGIHRIINSSNADIVHLHWIGHEFLSISEICKINKPIVWTLHDMWAFCGAEHCDDLTNPGRFLEGYHTNNRPPGRKWLFDVDRWVWQWKQKNWKKVQFHFVTPSRWLAKCLQKSALLKNSPTSVIPNCLNTDIFSPYDKKSSRYFFHLPENKKLLLYGAHGGDQNPLKGFNLLKESLKIIKKSELGNDIECVTFGDRQKGVEQVHGIPLHHVGYINDDHILAKLYSSADMFVTPSKIDNLPNTVMESMSCGTPCLAFAIGGMPDLIEHKQTGYLAQKFNIRDLANGILWIFDKLRIDELLGKTCRQKVIQNYHPDVISQKYIIFYKRVLNISSESKNV